MFKFNNKVDTDEKKIDEILSRGVSQIFPSKEVLKKELLSGKKLRIYTGMDATAPGLHLGNSKNLILLERLRRLGHEVVILFGDFTAQIGDPTDKMASRVRLSKKDVEKNLKTWKKQVSKVVSLRGLNSARIERNSRWLSKLSFEDVVELSANFTVQQMIERDMFQKRIKEAKPIYLHEFLYPLMQGYDSVALDVDLETGGSDQTFNMLAGRTLQRKINQKEKYVISMTLLIDPNTGKKLMSKSEGNYVSLEDSSDDMFGKIMSLPDEVIIQMLTDMTFKSLSDIAEIENKLKDESLNPMDAKKQLAKEIITIYHDAKKAEQAEQKFEKTFSKGEAPEDLLEIFVEPESNLSDTLISSGVVSSKSDWRRLVEQGGVNIIDNNQKVSDFNYKITNSATYRIGKRRFIKINLKTK
jgi:tyrosyl-tRNA synthetase